MKPALHTPKKKKKIEKLKNFEENSKQLGVWVGRNGGTDYRKVKCLLHNYIKSRHSFSLHPVNECICLIRNNTKLLALFQPEKKGFISASGVKSGVSVSCSRWTSLRILLFYMPSSVSPLQPQALTSCSCVVSSPLCSFLFPSHRLCEV